MEETKEIMTMEETTVGEAVAPVEQSDIHVVSKTETAVAVGVVGTLSVLAWEFAIKPAGKWLGGKAKTGLQKAKTAAMDRKQKKSKVVDAEAAEVTDVPEED